MRFLEPGEPQPTFKRWSSVIWERPLELALRLAATHLPAAHKVLGEWLPNAQGEDVVAGIRTPGPLHAEDEVEQTRSNPSKKEQPKVYKELIDTSWPIRATLHRHSGCRVHCSR